MTSYECQTWPFHRCQLLFRSMTNWLVIGALHSTHQRRDHTVNICFCLLMTLQVATRSWQRGQVWICSSKAIYIELFLTLFTLKSSRRTRISSTLAFPTDWNKVIRSDERPVCSPFMVTMMVTHLNPPSMYERRNELISLCLSGGSLLERWVIDFGPGSNQNGETLIKVRKVVSLLLGLDDRSGNSGDMFQHTKRVLETTRACAVAEMTLVRLCHKNAEKLMWWMKWLDESGEPKDFKTSWAFCWRQWQTNIKSQRLLDSWMTTENK